MTIFDYPEYLPDSIDKEENQLTIDEIIIYGICSASFLVILTAPFWENFEGKCVLCHYIKNNKKMKMSIKVKYFDTKTFDLLINTFAPLDDIYDNFKSANTSLKKEFKNLYIKYSVQLSMIKDSLIEIQKMLKHSNDVEKQEIYKKIKQEIKKNINPLIIQIVSDSNTIVLNYEKYVEDKNNAIHQLTKNELENKTLFNVNNYEMEIDKLKKKYVKKK